MRYVFKSFQSILRDMIAKFLAETEVNDINIGSVLTTFLETVSQEISQNYFIHYQGIRSVNLDSCKGEEIDTYANSISSDLIRLESSKATSYIVISDPSVTKVSTTIYSGGRGPVSGQTYLDLNSSTGFTSTGSLIVGRGSDNAETIAYTSISAIGPYFRFTLSAPLSNDHGSDEIVVLSQGGDRLIPNKTIVYVPASDFADKIQFTTIEEVTILDGESSSDPIAIEAIINGSSSNVGVGAISDFESIPFSGATVTNENKITNGFDSESDDDFKNRIKTYIQSISLGTLKAIIYGLTGLSSEEDNKKIISVKVRQPTTLNDDAVSYAFIDDGVGLEPSSTGVGIEEVLTDSLGKEKFLQTKKFPIRKANIESSNSQPFNLVGGETLIFEVDGERETITLSSAFFSVSGYATAQEVAEAINDLSSIVEARTTENGEKIIINSITNTNEKIQVIGGTANSIILFNTNEVDTIDLYKFDGTNIYKLTKDGVSAYVESTTGPFNLVGGETLTVIVDNKIANPQSILFSAGDFVLSGSATAQEVADKINEELAGATASVYNNKVRITSNKGRSSLAFIRVTGGTANSTLAFSTTRVDGSDKDYTLNRYNGQIELESTAEADESYTIGSSETRAFFISENTEPFVLADGDQLSFDVDGGSTKTVTFLSADFNNIGLATAQECADKINLAVDGVYADDFNGKLRIRTNSWSSTYGSLSIILDPGFLFETNTIKQNFQPHGGFLVSDSGPFSIVEDDNLVVVIDGVKNGRTFNITTQIDGKVTTGDNSGTYSTFIANISSISANFNTIFTTDDILSGFSILWTSGTNIGDTSSVSTYDSATGRFTLSAGTTDTIDIDDEFIILPTTAKNMVELLNSPITSSLSTMADISLADDGEKIQISSLSFGSSSSVQITGGTANDELGFSTTISSGKNGYSYFTGIVKEAQNTINGLDSDFSNYPGVGACGAHIEVITPLIKTTQVSYSITYLEGYNESFVNNKVKTLIVGYVNSLKIGEDLYISDLINTIKKVDGIKDVTIITPSTTVSASDNEVIRTSLDRVYIS